MSSYDDYVKLLNSRPEGETYYECLILSHSKFSQTFYLVFDTQELLVETDTGGVIVFQPANIQASRAVNSNDLDQQATFTLPDVNNALDDELDRIPLNDAEKPLCEYRIYHSNDLLDPVERIVFDIQSVAQKKGAFTLKTGVPDLNRDKTGEIFSYDRFPMLRTV